MRRVEGYVSGSARGRIVWLAGYRLVVLVVAASALSILVAAPAGFAANADCESCHSAGGVASSHVDFGVTEVAPVDRSTACIKCHWEPFVAHPYHNATWNCGVCHSGMGVVDVTAIPKVSTAYGWFNTAGSANADPQTLHVIHESAHWAGSVTKNGRRCVSCHAGAACTACHEGPLSPSHADHTWDESSGAYVEGMGPANTSFGGGTSIGNEAELNVSNHLTCSNATCHDITSGSYAPVVHDDYHSAVTYTGTWGLSGQPGYFANTYSRSNAAGAKATLAFNGQRVVFISDRGAYRGIARIWIDGVAAADVDLYSSATEKQYAAFTSQVLASGTHTITVEVLRQKNASARDYHVAVDAFKVYPMATTGRTECSTCHDHGTGPDFCYDCHSGPRGVYPGEEAFSLTKHASTTSSTIASSTWPDTAYPAGNCRNCHGTHDSQQRAEGNELCFTCHDAASAVLPSAYSYRGETTYTASGHGTRLCAACHNVHGGSADGTTYPALLASEETTVCYTCHAEASNSEHGIDIRARFTASADHRSHHGVTADEQVADATKVQCSSCHQPHASNGTLPIVEPGSRYLTPFGDTVPDPRSTPDWTIYTDRDAWVTSHYGDVNHGHATTMPVGNLVEDGTTYETRVLMHFDLSAIPAGSNVAAASLGLLTPNPTKRTGTLRIYKITRDWDEGTQVTPQGNMPPADGLGATWDKAKYHPEAWTGDPGSGDWVTRGGDMVATPYATLSLDSNSLVQHVSITSLVQEWVASGENYGLMIAAPFPGTTVGLMTSREYANIGAAPFVTVRGVRPADAPLVPDEPAFCLGCHGSSVPAGVSMGTGMRVIGPYYITGEAHGGRAGAQNGSAYGYDRGGALKPPYFYGMDPLPCSDCHDPHGSSNWSHLNETINGAGWAPFNTSNGLGIGDLCDNCHDLPQHGRDPASAGAGWETCFGCHRHGGDF